MNRIRTMQPTKQKKFNLWRLIRDERGVAAIEMAFALPVFMFCVYGIIEFGRYAYTQGALLYAAEETTRYATVNYDATTDQLMSIASGHAVGIKKQNIKAINVDETLNAVDQTKLVTVQIQYNHEFLLPIFDAAGVTIEGSSKGFLVEK